MVLMMGLVVVVLLVSGGIGSGNDTGSGNCIGTGSGSRRDSDGVGGPSSVHGPSSGSSGADENNRDSGSGGPGDSCPKCCNSATAAWPTCMEKSISIF